MGIFISSNSSQSVSISNNRVTINGKTIECPNGNISVINGRVYSNGVEVNTDDTDLKSNKHAIINIKIEGSVDKVNCNGNIEVNGNVTGDMDCNGSISIIGNVNGDIDCGGSANIKGDHKGSIDAGGSVNVR